MATAGDEYIGIAELDAGRFRVLDNRSHPVGTAPTIAEAETLLRRTPSHRVRRGVTRTSAPIRARRPEPASRFPKNEE
ncbi:hypothetical protein ACPPVW_06350 [Leifsonia sp. McL0607]|uniref:hypothetical protein n=1 Tax=Leifsonia sp. McL0607 TaxID=3415672 RepID=UPI003CEB83B7